MLDHRRLKHDGMYRLQHIAEFIGLTSEDWNALKRHQEKLVPVIKKLVSETYVLLTRYTYTKEALLSTREKPEGGPESRIPMRSKLLEEYLVRIATWGAPDAELWKAMIDLAVLHKNYVRVGLEHMCALLGKLEGVFVMEVTAMDPESIASPDKAQILAAMNKILWLQNDVFIMVYSDDETYPRAPA